MSYNKITFPTFVNDELISIQFDLKDSVSWIVVEPTTIGFLHHYYISIESCESDSEAFNGHISVEVSTFEFHSGIKNICCPKKDAIPIFFDSKRGQSSYYDGQHNDLNGSLRLFGNDGLNWLHLQSDSLSANVPIDFSGYYFPSIHKNLITNKMHEAGINLADIRMSDFPGDSLGEMYLGSIKK